MIAALAVWTGKQHQALSNSSNQIRHEGVAEGTK